MPLILFVFIAFIYFFGGNYYANAEKECTSSQSCGPTPLAFASSWIEDTDHRAADLLEKYAGITSQQTRDFFDVLPPKWRSNIRRTLAGCAAHAESSGTRTHGFAIFAVQRGKTALYTRRRNRNNQDRVRERCRIGQPLTTLHGEINMGTRVRGNSPKRIVAEEKAKPKDTAAHRNRRGRPLRHHQLLVQKGFNLHG